MPAPGVRDPAPGPRGAASVPVDGEASDQLRAALLSRAKAHALVGLSAISVTSQDRDAIRVALDILGQGATAQVGNALETIEAAQDPRRSGRCLACGSQQPRTGERTPTTGEPWKPRPTTTIRSSGRPRSWHDRN